MYWATALGPHAIVDLWTLAARPKPRRRGDPVASSDIIVKLPRGGVRVHGGGVQPQGQEL